MKKLMTTLFAAAAAFGLRAADPGAVSGTSFEGQPAGDYIITDGTGELPPALEEGQTYWETNETATLTVVNGTSAEGQFPGTGINRRPLAFENDYQNQYLKIKTTLGNPVTRNVGTNGLGIAIKKDGEGAYDGLYFDSLVKFTAFDSNPEIILGNDGKLAIWLEEKLNDNDVPTKTNLVITAGYLDGSQTRVVATNYVCDVDGVNFNDGGWHRVTVKALDSIYKTGDAYPGFVVFVDGHYAMCEEGKGITGTLTDAAKSWNDVDALFPSAVQLGGSKQTIASVSFDGQGEVDDLVFTTKAPSFAKDDEYFTITLDSNIASVTYQVDGEEDEVEITETTPITYTPGMKVRIVDADGKDAYMFDDVTPGSGVGTETEESVLWYVPSAAEQGITVNAKSAGAKTIVGGVTNKYETVAAAFADINNLEFSGSAVVIMSTSFDEGLSLTNANANVVLDLAGNDITGVADEAAITLIDGTLLITNSTVAVGHVVGVPADGEDPAPAVALGVEGGLATIAGGCFDGVVTPDSELVAITGDAKIRIAENEGDIDTLKDCVILEGYTLAEEEGESPVYYVVALSQGPTTVRVDFVNGELIVATTNIAVGTTLVAPEVSKTDYTLSGWFYGNPAEEWDFEDPVTEAMTLVAEWTATSYSISYLNEDGSAFDDWAEGYVVTNSYTVEDVIVLPTADNINFGEVVGVSFVAWTNETGTVAGWPAGGMTGPVTVYAKLNVVVPPTKHDAGATILCEDATEAEELAADITATPAAYVNVPAGVANGAAYCALFRGVADGSKVTIELTADAKTAAQTAADAAAATIPLSAIASGTIGSVVVIDAVPGLYYSLSVGETCTGLVENTPRVLAQDTGTGANINEGKISLTVGKPDEDATAGFYKVNVNIEPAPQN